MAEQKDIHAIKEMLAAVQVLAVAVKKVMKDGKVDLSDASVLIDLGSQFPVFAAAFADIGELPAEAKDIDAAEAVEIVKAIYDIAKAVQAA